MPNSMIPRRIFWSLDILVLLMAFVGAYLWVPMLVPLYANGESSPQDWMTFLSIPRGGGNALPDISSLFWIFLAMLPGTILFLEVSGCYRPLLDLSRGRMIFGALAAPIAGLCFTALVLFALKDPGYSRTFMFMFAAFSGLGFLLSRGILRSYYRYRHASGHYARNVVLIGTTADVSRLSNYFRAQIDDKHYQVQGYLVVPSPRDSNAIPGIPCLGHVDELSSMLNNKHIHDVIVAQSGQEEAWTPSVIESCDYFGITLHILPSVLLEVKPKFLLVWSPTERLQLPSVVFASPHANSEVLFIKRIFDLVVSSVMLLLLSPVFALIALAIKITTPSLPVFYKWKVVGRNGHEFTGYKFTTMISDADQRKNELLHKNEMQGPVFKIKDDPRVTSCGKFLRKYSLNELPQLWSVLKGDMSLVGPRPAFRHELERYELWHKRKLSISPGITCLWQVRGRNKISNFDDWVKMDLEYIDNWSLWLDFKILVRTAWVVLTGTGS